MRFFILLLFPLMVSANQKVETFVVQVQDRSLKILSPEKKTSIMTVLVENRSLSDQVAKFTVAGKNIKFVSIPSGKSETVEIDNKTGATVTFVPLSPAFQEVELHFGKKAYEIPSKE